ncbi:MAG: N-methylhydantoinase [Solirubrobacteraceae bacterium]|nr:N-methylhydantoinase [Solirubrobacteraceae bacterium]
MTTGARVGIDVGGTFTDLAAVVGERLVTAKVPSTPDDQARGVMDVLARSGLDAGSVATFAHGMTVATNALLERRGARTAFITTEGFRDVLEIGRQDRPSLYALDEDRPAALVPRELRFTVHERMGPDGELEPLDAESLEDALARLAEADVEAVAVGLLFGFLHSGHERRVGEAVREALPNAHVSLSCEVLPEFREYERFATTAADAYLAPRLERYLRSLATRAADAGLPEPMVMQSSGGVLPISVAARRAAGCVLSGPAGGVVGAVHAARASGLKDVLTFDMGGTSTDVAPIVGGRAQTTTEAVVAGVPLRLPMVDVHTVSAGGGSIAWADAGGALRVGPRSAGAEPGPASYGRGGTEPTVTDANLLLGYLPDGERLGGSVQLDGARAERALGDLGARLGLDALQTAVGVVRVANAHMARALRAISIERGLDPREFALVAFGGAGGMHALALAEELGIPKVLVPRACGVLSALGLALSDLRRDYVAPVLRPLDDGGLEAVATAARELEATARADLPSPTLERRADLRYRGQSFELTVDAAKGDELAENFHAAHERRYGYRMDDERLEVVCVRVTATVPAPAATLGAPAGTGAPSGRSRRAYFDGEWLETAIVDEGALAAGRRVSGPALVELAEATCVVHPGWEGVVDEAGGLMLERVS